MEEFEEIIGRPTRKVYVVRLRNRGGTFKDVEFSNERHAKMLAMVAKDFGRHWGSFTYNIPIEDK